MEKQVVIITGASSGMGYEAAKRFNEKGWIVYAGARRVERMKELETLGIHTMLLDVTNTDSNQNLVDTVIKEQGQIDVLINNAGYGEYGPTEEISMKKARAQLDVNLFAAAELANMVIPIMRKQKSGRIVNISSTGGDQYTPLGAWYYASKAALQQWSDTLDLELRNFGIRSVIVQPGGTRTEWAKVTLEKIKENLAPLSPYKKMVDALEGLTSRQQSGRFANMAATPADLAKVFYKAATDKRPKWRYFHSFPDRMLTLIGRHFPRSYRAILNQFMMKRFSQ
ncbi:SDR family NAD(P)-dependent oxidoreductase [Cohnella sp. GbtcB17]|uniref:SDR family NAD(P)-dependent oxidoreductase n=1 Tax=Cohnella sp. GbtcB17 TaxID=2824762 RepID=UPI0020C7106C|nr:SDR family NAD(P)-dependent oxidoreductase [Cohnella sp. GbtcB17]